MTRRQSNGLIWLTTALVAIVYAIFGLASVAQAQQAPAAAATVTNPFNITVTVAPPPSTALQVPGPSAALYANNPYYTCTGNRYVAVGGSWQNSGLDTAHPWDLQGAAGNSLPPGTCINVAPGIYTEDEVDFQYGGANASKTGYIVWRCTTMPFKFVNGALQGEGSGCVIKLKPTNQYYLMRFRPSVSYIMIDGFEFDGLFGNANSTVCFSAEENAAPPNHHIWVFNSDFHGCGQSGLQINFSDWVFVIHNVWHDNASVNCVMGSGLSMWQPVQLAGYSSTPGNPDYWHSNTENLTYHNVIAYNVGYHNFNPQGPCGATANTDGEAIILDTWDHHWDACPGGSAVCPPNAPTLVMGNLAYNNGGNGIEVFNGDANNPVTFVNNTVFSNNWDKYNAGTWRAGSLTQTVGNMRWLNNISVAVRGTGITQNNSAYLGQQNGAPCPTGNIWKNNLMVPPGALNFDGGSCNTFPAPPNASAANAGFTNQNLANPNFGLATGSTAIGLGTAFDLWQQSGPTDAGACPRNPPGPTTACP